MAADLAATFLGATSPTRAGFSLRYAPLPFRPPPLHDELLSSWLSRVARANHCDTRELCCYVGFDDGFPPDAVDDDCAVDWRRLQRTLRLDAPAMRALLLPAEPLDLRGSLDLARLVAPVRVQVCRSCIAKANSAIELRRWRWGGELFCRACGAALTPTTGQPMTSGGITSTLRRRATAGAAYINQALSTGDQVALRRARLAVRLGAAILDKSVFWTLLFSPDRYVRQFLLAAVAASRHRPIKAAVLATAELEDRGLWRLHQAFPERARAARLVNALAAQRAASVRSAEPRWDAVDAPMANRFKVAAQWAMADLGTGASERALFRRADALLRSIDNNPAHERTADSPRIS